MAIFNHIGKVRRCMGERIPRVAWRTPDRTDRRGRRTGRTVEDAGPNGPSRTPVPTGRARYNEVSANPKSRRLLPSRYAANPQSSFHSLRGTPAACLPLGGRLFVITVITKIGRGNYPLPKSCARKFSVKNNRETVLRPFCV